MVEVISKYILNEQKIIHLLLGDKPTVEDLLEGKISSEYFSDRHKFLITCIFQEYLDNESSFPRLLTKETYKHYLKIKYGNTGQVLTNLKLYDTCVYSVKSTPDDLGVLKIELINGYAARFAQRSFEEYEKNISTKGSFLATQELSTKLSHITVVGSRKKNTFITVDDAKDEYLKDKKEKRENPDLIIKTGINEFDKAMVGGISPQTLTIIVADTGVGKTSVMLNMALNIVKAGHNILFVSLEMNYLRLMDRIMSNLSGIILNKICQPHTMNEKEVKDLEASFDQWNDIKGKFAILDTYDRLSTEVLRREIELRSMVFQPAVVFVDYIGKVKPGTVHKDRHDLELGQVTGDLIFLGKRYGFGSVSAAQLNREAIRRIRKNKEDLAGSEDVRGSGEISNDADFIFALFPSEEGNRLKGQNIKSRHGESHSKFNLYFDGSRCRIGNYVIEDMLPKDMDADFSTILSPNPNEADEQIDDDLDEFDFGVDL